MSLIIIHFIVIDLAVRNIDSLYYIKHKSERDT